MRPHVYKSPELPRAVQRSNNRWVVTVVLSFVFCLVLMFVLERRLQFLGQNVAAFASFAPAILVFLAAVLLPHRAERRLRARLKETGNRLCPNCLYDLSRGPMAGHCAECGSPYDADVLSKAWGVYLESRNWPPQPLD